MIRFFGFSGAFFTAIALGSGCRDTGEKGGPGPDAANSGPCEDGDPVDRHPDADGDGYGAAGVVAACADDPAFADVAGDCDDGDPAVHPGADERCDGRDDDCDGGVDNGPGGGEVWYVDADGDGFGAPGSGEARCGSIDGWSANDLDCDDGDAGANPDAEEVCGDEDDDDCDGLPDVGEVGRWYEDRDGDGYGHPGLSADTCEPEPGWVQDNTDCRPSDPEAYPGADERCNETDDDCDGEIDEGMDSDADGYRSTLCADGTDCDDDDPDAWPDSPAERCEDGVDSDCDGVDEPCGFDPSILLSGADAYVYSDSPTYGLGLLVDVGDATGDGVPDVLASSVFADGYSGAGFLLPGPISGHDSAQNLGYRLSGSAAVTYGAGRSIGIADIDGDGVEDLGFGAPYGSYPGTYVALGPITGDRDISAPDAWLSCEAGIYCGHGGDFGDFTGDGIADAAIGAYRESTGALNAGAVFVLAGPITGDVSLEDAANRITSASKNELAGRYVYAGGDVNGDGLGELLVAAPCGTGSGGTYSGLVYRVAGPASITALADAEAIFLGAGPSGFLGEGGAMGIGDLDGDGYGDVALGSASTASGSASGAAWVVLGPVTGSIDLHSADLTVEGAGSRDHAGAGVSIGDINRDGVGELLVGASADGTGSASGGAAYLFFGRTSGTLDTSSADAAFLGDAPGAQAGTSVVLGDANGDGDADVVVGAPYEGTAGSYGGAVFVQYAVR